MSNTVQLRWRKIKKKVAHIFADLFDLSSGVKIYQQVLRHGGIPFHCLL